MMTLIIHLPNTSVHNTLSLIWPYFRRSEQEVSFEFSKVAKMGFPEKRTVSVCVCVWVPMGGSDIGVSWDVYQHSLMQISLFLFLSHWISLSLSLYVCVWILTILIRSLPCGNFFLINVVEKQSSERKLQNMRLYVKSTRNM